jgi:hypothetical protein
MILSDVKDKIDEYFANAGIEFRLLSESDEPRNEVDEILAYYRKVFDIEADKDRYYWLSGFLRDYYNRKV